MGNMNEEQANRVLSAARRLGASETYASGGRAYVRLQAYGPSLERLGDLDLEISSAGPRIRRYWHSSCSGGVMWSRRAARAVAALDTVRLQAC